MFEGTILLRLVGNEIISFYLLWYDKSGKVEIFSFFETLHKHKHFDRSGTRTRSLRRTV